MYSTRIFSDIVECLSHRNSAIRNKSEKMSEFILEYDRKVDGELGQLAKSIIRKRFENYNKLWLTNAIGSNYNSAGPSNSSVYGLVNGSYSGDLSLNTLGSNSGGGGGNRFSPDGGGIMMMNNGDRLPTSQEMMNGAKFLNEKVSRLLGLIASFFLSFLTF
jgi:hypothetical protein